MAITCTHCGHMWSWKTVRACTCVCTYVCAPLLSVSVKTAKALFWRRVKAGYHHGSRGYVYKEVSVSSKNIQQNQIRAGARVCVCVCVCVCVFVNTKLDLTSLRFPWYYISKLLLMCVSTSVFLFRSPFALTHLPPYAPRQQHKLRPSLKSEHIVGTQEHTWAHNFRYGHTHKWE